MTVQCAELDPYGRRCTLPSGHSGEHQLPATQQWAPKQASRGRSKWLGAIVVVIFGLLILGSVNKPDTPAAPAFVPPWFPAQFSSTEDPNVAYRWLQKNEFSCEIMDTCWGMLVISRNGCPSGLYVEVSVSDSAGTAVGYSNDTVGSVAAGQQAKLIFENTDAGGKHAKLTDVSCR